MGLKGNSGVLSREGHGRSVFGKREWSLSSAAEQFPQKAGVKA